jgi:glycogen synthase
VETVLATMGPLPNEQQIEEASGIPEFTLQVAPYRLEWMEEPWEDVRKAGEWLLELEAKHAPDLIHLNNFAHGVLPWHAPVLMVAHSCVLSWWEAVRQRPAPPEWQPYREAVRKGLAAVDLVLAPTGAMITSLGRHYDTPRATRVVRNGRDPSLFRPAPPEPFILSAGRLWDEAKNVLALDEVAPRLPWPIYLAGSDQHPEGGRVVPRHARSLGQLPTAELAQWMGRASIYALPARYEPFGLSILEAAYSGCALVLGDLTSLRELWQDAALFVPPNDPAALENALQRLINEPAHLEDLAGAARTRAFEYTPERMAAGYLAAYRWLLDDTRDRIHDPAEDPAENVTEDPTEETADPEASECAS